MLYFDRLDRMTNDLKNLNYFSYRISFHCSLLSVRDRRKIQSLKNQADWLLHNIIPRHVSESLKKSAQYSENHREVGIIFASLVNFNELYDESYMGGKEYLRVLNELISDFDEILDRAEFRNVEKIKTIGSTFMAASGMNPYIRHENTDKYQHLREMLEFVFELQRSVSDFNQSLIEFDLILRIGFNFGDVTAECSLENLHRCVNKARSGHRTLNELLEKQTNKHTNKQT